MTITASQKNDSKLAVINKIPLYSHAWDNIHGNMWDINRQPDDDHIIDPLPTVFNTDTNYNFIICGPTGGGKTSCGVLLCIYNAIMRGKRVFSNTPIHFNVYDIHNNKYRVESEEFDLVKFVDADPMYWDSFVLIDESNFSADSKRVMSNLNMSVTDIMQEGRKMGMSMVFTVLNLYWLDSRIISTLADLKIECHDVYFTEYGKRQNLLKGELVKWSVWDISGKYTGHPLTEIGAFHIQNRKLWGAFDTRFFIKPGEARKRIVRRGNQVVIGADGKEYDPQRMRDTILTQARKLAATRDDITAAELWDFFGAHDKGQQTLIGSVLKQHGVERHQEHDGERHYDLVALHT